jgi:hypothetical protein
VTSGDRSAVRVTGIGGAESLLVSAAGIDAIGAERLGASRVPHFGGQISSGASYVLDKRSRTASRAITASRFTGATTAGGGSVQVLDDEVVDLA